MIEKTLMIRGEHLEKILRGSKTWEVRSRPTNLRGRIALSEKGAARIVGSCTLRRVVGPLSIDRVLRNARRMGTSRKEVAEDLAHWKSECRDKRVYAWELGDARRFRKPVPFKNPSGAVTWATLPPRIAARLR